MFLITSYPQLTPPILNSSTPGSRFSPPVIRRMEFVRKLGRKCCVVQSTKLNRKPEVVDVGSGEDVFDDGAKAVPPDHLLIMVNGIIGRKPESKPSVLDCFSGFRHTPMTQFVYYFGFVECLSASSKLLLVLDEYSAADWSYAAKQFVKRLPDKVIVHCSDCNSATLTFDGVDRMGERLAEEVVIVAKRWPEVSKISFIAHSLGGLVARYAIGRLYQSIPACHSPNLNQNNEKDSEQSLEQLFEARIAGLQPINFITVATPHLGSRGHRQLPILCGLPFLERRAPQTAHWIVGRSGKHLFLTDNDNGRRPLLLQMVNDSENIKFISALGSFKRRVAYANANYDQVVGWRTSSIRRQHELPKSNLLVKDDKYPHIVYVERESSDAIQNGISSVDTPPNLEEEMIRGLNQVPWERVDVSFHKSTQRYVAHTTIQVKNYWLNSDGADVVLHMIDNFLL